MASSQEHRIKSDLTAKKGYPVVIKNLINNYKTAVRIINQQKNKCFVSTIHLQIIPTIALHPLILRYT
jgi:hypothetical protein